MWVWDRSVLWVSLFSLFLAASAARNMRPDVCLARHNVSNNSWVSCWDAGHVVGRRVQGSLSSTGWDCKDSTDAPPRKLGAHDDRAGRVALNAKVKLSEPTLGAQGGGRWASRRRARTPGRHPGRMEGGRGRPGSREEDASRCKCRVAKPTRAG